MRLTRAIGKSRAMELVLTGRQINAQEAAQWGLVSRVVAEGEGEVVKEAVKVANEIAAKGQVAVQAAKEVVNAGEWYRGGESNASLLMGASSVRAQLGGRLAV